MSPTVARSKVQPTHYPRIPFHCLRSAQLLSSVVVASVMLFFISNLRHDGYSIPWTFLLLTTVSILTIASLTTTIVLHCCCGLNPRLNLLLNSSLLCIWTLGFALLTWWSSGTLGHVCNRANWRNADGIMVCRIYKALFAFSMLGFVSTIAALILDIYVFRRATRRGKYNQMQNLDLKRSSSPGPALHSFEPDPEPELRFRERERERERNPNPYALRGQRKRGEREQEGYALPEEQFEYDTGYHGAHRFGVMRE